MQISAGFNQRFSTLGNSAEISVACSGVESFWQWNIGVFYIKREFGANLLLKLEHSFRYLCFNECDHFNAAITLMPEDAVSRLLKTAEVL